MKIVVTGGAGFIGSHVAQKLSQEGHDVVVIDNLSSYYSVNLKLRNVEEIEKSGVSFIKKDLTSCKAEDFSNAGLVYHFAAQPGISSSTTFSEYEHNNILATYTLLEALKESKSLKLFVNISTSSVYGKEAVSSEDKMVKPASFYGVTKLAAEQLSLSYMREFNIPVTSLRLFSVFGPRERPDKLFPKLIKSILEQTPFTLYKGSKYHKRSFTYVDDIVRCCSLLPENIRNAEGEIFNIGNDATYSTDEGIHCVEEILGKKALITEAPPRIGDQRETKADIDKARSVLGWEPETSLYRGLEKYIEWYKNTQV